MPLLKKVVIVLSGFFPLLPSLASGLDVPDQFMLPPEVEGKVVGVGMGEGKPEALTRALGALVANSKASEKSSFSSLGTGDKYEESSKITGSVSLGDISVKILIREHRDVEGALLESVTRATYRSSEDTAQTATLNYASTKWEQGEQGENEGSGNGAVAESFEFTRGTCSLNSLIAELEQNNVEITSYESKEGRYFIMLIWTLP